MKKIFRNIIGEIKNKPNPSFKKRLKYLYLQSYRKEFKKELDLIFHLKLIYFIRGLIGGIAAIVIFISAASYAEYRNVSPDSILYPLKRYKENVSLIFTPEEDLPFYHLKLAERRLDEIEVLKDITPGNKKIQDLLENFSQEAEKSFQTMKEPIILSKDKSDAAVDYNTKEGFGVDEISKPYKLYEEPIDDILKIQGNDKIQKESILLKETKQKDLKREYEDKRNINKSKKNVEEKILDTEDKSKTHGRYIVLSKDLLTEKSKDLFVCAKWREIIDKAESLDGKEFKNKTNKIKEKFRKKCQLDEEDKEYLEKQEFDHSGDKFKSQTSKEFSTDNKE